MDPINTPAAPALKPKRRFVGASSRPNASRGGKAVPPRRVNQIPDEILNDKALNEAISDLPANYSFEIHKTVHALRKDKIQCVALQMPEGLMIYGPIIADILEEYTYPETPEGKWDGMTLEPLLLADVTYGACCIDDFTAKEMGAEMIVHYGHSCLIPVSQTTLKTLYIFVEIAIDPLHLSLSVRRNFPSESTAFQRTILDRHASGSSSTSNGNSNGTPDKGKGRLEIGIEEDSSDIVPVAKKTKIALVSTVQFISAVHALREALEEALPSLDAGIDKDDADVSTAGKGKSELLRIKAEEVGVWRGAYEIVIPQSKPLSPGEVLGCTAPKLDDDVDALIYVGDGRFHLESIMIANPSCPAFRYDPYDKKFTREGYEHEEMRGLRGEAVKQARKNLLTGTVTGDAQVGIAEDKEVYEGNAGAAGFGVVLGTLGRQGSLSVLKTIKAGLPTTDASTAEIPPYLLLLSELSPQKLDLLPHSQLSTFVQTSCPRLSIDWGYAFSRPLLSPYEASVASGRIKGWGGLRLEDGLGTSVGEGGYPMDFYSDDSLGPWTPRHGMGRPKRVAV